MAVIHSQAPVRLPTAIQVLVGIAGLLVVLVWPLVTSLAADDSKVTAWKTSQSVQQNPPSGGALNPDRLAPPTQSEVPAKSGEIPSYLQYIELKKAMYGIPLGANLDDIRQWCEEKHVQITNATKTDVEADCKAKVQALKLLKDYQAEQDDLSYTKLEQKVNRLLEGNVMDEMDKIAALDIQTHLAILRAPSFSSKGTKHFLKPILEGLLYTVGQGQAMCSDDRITKGAYALVVAPSAEMQKDHVKKITIFLRTNGAGFVSYGAIVAFGAETTEATAEQLGIVMNVLNEKYGEWNEVNNEHDSKAGFQKLQNLCDELNRLTGVFSPCDVFGSLVRWRKNILMSGVNGFREANKVLLKGREFMLFYYEPDSAKELMTAQDAAIRVCQERGDLQKQKSQERIKDNF